MNRHHLRWLRDRATSIDYIFELGKGRISILQTLLMFFTFVKVYSMSQELTYILVAVLVIVVYAIGWFVERIKIPQKMADEKERRSPFMAKVLKNQEELKVMLLKTQEELKALQNGR